MTIANVDLRSAERMQRDEQIAAEPLLTPPNLPSDSKPSPVEDHLRRRRGRPQAYLGIVENGLIRPLEANVHLPEQSRVIIVSPAVP